MRYGSDAALARLINDVTAEFGGSKDLVVRRLTLDGATAAVFSIRELADKNYIAEKIIRPLMYADMCGFDGNFDAILQTTGIKGAGNAGEICSALCTGGAAVAVSCGGLYIAVCAADAYFGRSADKTETDVTVSGPRTAFVEDMEKNICLLRRVIRNPALRFTELECGTVTKTRVAVAYVAGRADEKLVAKVKAKLSRINAAVIVDSANLGMLLSGRRFGFFPSFGYTEKVDKAASLLVSGRVVIICDGSPFVLTLPYVFMESLQSAEDYLRSPYYATLMRFVRLLSLLAALYLPALFFIAADIRPDMLPAGMQEVISAEREEIPLGLAAELFIMLGVFEMLREVGVRMPQPVGNAVGLVGSIIIGDAATKAGIASTTVILVVAIAAVANFVVPAYMNTTVMLRFGFLAAVCLAGIDGLVAATGLTLAALCSKSEFGEPYMDGIYPFRPGYMDDFILAVPQNTLGRKELDGGKR